jgi:hypothetical protein
VAIRDCTNKPLEIVAEKPTKRVLLGPKFCVLTYGTLALTNLEGMSYAPSGYLPSR